MEKIYNARAQPLFYSLNRLFGDFLVAVVACLSSPTIFMLKQGLSGRSVVGHVKRKDVRSFYLKYRNV